MDSPGTGTNCRNPWLEYLAPFALTLAEVRSTFLAEAKEQGFGHGREAASELDDFLAEMNEPIEIADHWAVELGVPCFVTWIYKRRREHPAVLNPRLASLGLERRLDPFSAFQEITLFLGQRLAAEDGAPRSVGSDEVIAASKGFDKQSFRNVGPRQQEDEPAGKSRTKGKGPRRMRRRGPTQP